MALLCIPAVFRDVRALHPFSCLELALVLPWRSSVSWLPLPLQDGIPAALATSILLRNGISSSFDHFDPPRSLCLIASAQEACPCQIRALRDVAVVRDPPRGALVGCQAEIFLPRAPGRALALGGREAAAFQGGKQLCWGPGVLHIPTSHSRMGWSAHGPCGEGKGRALPSHLACKHPVPSVVCLYSQHPVAFRLTHMDGIIRAGPPVPLIFFEHSLWGGVWLGVGGRDPFLWGLPYLRQPLRDKCCSQLFPSHFWEQAGPGSGSGVRGLRAISGNLFSALINLNHAWEGAAVSV